MKYRLLLMLALVVILAALAYTLNMLESTTTPVPASVEQSAPASNPFSGFKIQ